MYSLVIPVYRNEESLQELVSQLTVLDRSLGHRLETVIVVDGSPDNSYSYLRHALPRTGLSAKLVLLSRNFGSFAAIRAGLTEASGPHFAVLAADLKEPPELARQFFAALEADEADVVIGTRMDREDPLRAGQPCFFGASARDSRTDGSLDRSHTAPRLYADRIDNIILRGSQHSGPRHGVLRSRQLSKSS